MRIFSWLFLLFSSVLSWAQPTITSFTPTSGTVGTTVTITGTGFSATTTNNIVWFGSVKAAVSAATTTQLTVTVPTGATYAPITITVSGLTRQSINPFTPTFGGNGVIDNSSFASKLDFSASTEPSYITAGDLDGDGKTDLVVSNSNIGTLSIYRNTATSGAINLSSFASKFDLAAGGQASEVVLTDLDGDGKLDVSVTNNIDQNITIYRNISTPGSLSSSSFAPSILVSRSNSGYGMSAADVDGDGKTDLIVGNTVPTNSIGVFRNTSTVGSISFATQTLFTAPGQIQNVAVGDIDGDGKFDIAGTSYATQVLCLWRNTSTVGSISMGTRADFSVSFPQGVQIADVDNDGKQDLLAASYGNSPLLNWVSVWKNQAGTGAITTGSLASAVAVTVGTGPQFFQLADLNGDTKPDLAVGNLASNSISVVRNMNTSGVINSSTFASKVDFSTTNSASDVVIADFDGDGRPDIAATNYASGSNTISVFRNQSSLPSPTITSFAPASGPIGTSVTITGTNFSTTPVNNIVYFGAVRATVTAATSTQLTVTAPVGAGAHPISVTTNNLTGYSQLPYRVINSTGIAIDVSSLQTRTDFTTASAPYKAVAADLDNDGKLDLISANIAGSISLFRNTATSGLLNASSFASSVDFAAPVNIAGPTAVLTADFDGDGKLDIATANYGNSASFSVFRNVHSSGAFSSSSLAARQDFVTQNGTFEIASGDLDLDGKPDIVVVSDGSSIISVYRNISSPGLIAFASKQDFAAGTQTSGVDLADIDGDGKPEVITANFAANSMSVFRNMSTAGSISLAAKFDFTTSINPYRVVAADFDNDGKIDIALSGNSVSVFRNTATSGVINAGSFAARVDLTTNAGALGIVSSDFDGDGRNDIAVGFSGLSTISVYRNTSLSGLSFSPKVDFTFGTSSLGVEAADLDGDGRPDLISSNNGASNLSIRRLQLNPIPTITNFTPTSGAVGSSVTITGTNFSTTAANNIVYFGAVKANVTAATATQLTVAVPTGATYSPITVTVNGLTAATNRPFIPLIVSNTTITSGMFSTKVDVATTNTNSFGDLSDLDGDGKIDVGVAQNFGFVSSLFRSTSSVGSFTFATKVDFAQNPISSVGFGDVDGDGKPDMITANGSANTISIYRNISSSGSLTSGSFAAKVDLAATDAYRIAVGDLDGDGKQEIVVARRSANAVTVFRNMSTSGSIATNLFSADVVGTTNTSPYDVRLADIDGDAKLDIFATSTGAASILRNTSSLGQLSFATKFDLATTTGEGVIGVGDLDGDGKLDIALPNGPTDVVAVFRNTSTSGSFSFASAVNFTAGDNPGGVAVADLNGDAKPELVVSNTTGNSISVLQNNASSGTINSGSFAAKIDLAVGTSPIMPLIGDLDGDTRLDLIGVNYGTGSTISILRNVVTATQPSAQPTALIGSNLQSTSFTVSFTGATGSPNGYLVLRKTGSSSTDVPIDGVTYVAGNTIGTSTVAYVGSASTFNETGLANNTTYFYDVFAYNGSGITINYNTISPLEGTLATLALEPSSQPTNFSIANRSTTGYDVTFSTAAGTPSGYLILERVGAIPTGVPVDGTNYTVGSVIGDGTVVQISATPSFTKSGLGTTQARSYAIFAFNGSGLSSNFLTSAPLTGTGITLDAEPTAQPTALQFSNVGLTSFTLSFTAAAGNPTGYLILRKAGSAPAETPVDGIEYTVGQSLGTSVVVASGAGLTLNETGLGNSTEYFYAVYAYNNVAPSRNYLTTNPLRGNQFTLVTEPTAQPTALPFTAISPTSVTINFMAAAGSPSGYLVIRKSLSSPTETPTDGVSYAAGSVLGSSTVAYVGAATSFTDSGLTAATTYFYDVFSYNGSGTSLNYLVTNPLEMNTSTLSLEPGGAPTGLTFTSFQASSLTGSFAAATDSPSGYIVLRKAGSSPSEVPVDGATYTNGVTIGTSTVVSIGNSTTFTDSGLDPATTYHYDIYSYNGSGNNINYGNTPLEGSRATLATEPAAQPVISISNVSATGMTLNITAATGNPSGYLILRKVGSSPLEVPVDGTAYTDGQTLGTSSVVYSGPANSFAITGLVANTTYFFDVFSFNGNTTTINYLTTSPREASQTTLGADNTPPSVSADRTVTSIPTGTNLLVDVDVTDTGSGVNEVTLQYRTVNATSPNFTDVAMTKGTGNAWTQTIPAAAITELGVEYRIKMKDVAANEATSAVKRVAVTFPAAGAPIVYTSFGNTVANYRIVAIPLSVTNNAVSNVFDEFGAFDETQWRVFHYDNSRTPALQPLTASSLLEPGKGYWLISNKQVSAINTGPGNSVSLTGDAFEITLNQGWNQIGNPFNFDISWTDIRTANPTLASQLGTTARTWTGSQINIDEIKKSEGAYINFSGASGAKLKIPTTKNPAINGRLSQSKVINAIDQPHWEVMFRLENSTQSQEINGLGMHPEAHDGLDGLDDYNLPRFFSYLEIVHPKRVADMIVAKDMVPAQSDYVWSFSIETSEKEPYTLRWENGYFGNNERQIWLVDETTGMSVNMRDKQEIKFSYLPQRKMKVVYGSLDFVSRTIASEKISLWSVPNPVASKLSTTVVLPKADRVSLSLIDTKGTMTQLLYEGELKSGMHQLSFNLEGMSNGLYLLKLTTSAGIKFEKILKQE